MPDATNSAARVYRENRGGRCGGCGAEATSLRRGRCASCYARWVRARPVGAGAICGACNDRRLAHLRHFELHTMWVVLCHNCAARADKVSPMPRSLDGLVAILARDRRLLERRDGRGPGMPATTSDGTGRRGGDRRVSERNLLDAAGCVVELEADYAHLAELGDWRSDTTSVTDVHLKL